LSTKQLDHISTYIDILRQWNARINLTAVRDPEEIVTRHFGESLFAARCLRLTNSHIETEPIRLADLGSGAGFPGIPIKLWMSDVAVTLIESHHKKAAFLREVTRSLLLTDVRIENTRAESLPPSTFNVVTLRAVERFSATLQTATNLLVPGGRLMLLISSSQFHTTQSVLPTLSWEAPIPVPCSQSRIVLVSQPGK